jgi:hypothetical protein
MATQPAISKAPRHQSRATAYVAEGIFRIVKTGSKHEQFVYFGIAGGPLVKRVRFTHVRHLAAGFQSYDLALAYMSWLESQEIFASDVFGVRRDGEK